MMALVVQRLRDVDAAIEERASTRTATWAVAEPAAAAAATVQQRHRIALPAGD